VIEALGRELPRREVAISSISLISQAPEHRWTWHPVADMQFGGLPVRVLWVQLLILLPDFGLRCLFAVWARHVRREAQQGIPQMNSWLRDSF
jgi:hypothetical protein